MSKAPGCTSLTASMYVAARSVLDAGVPDRGDFSNGDLGEDRLRFYEKIE